jgi:hypothetical protein
MAETKGPGRGWWGHGSTKYSEEDVERVLGYLAVNRGNAVKTREKLAEDGHPAPSKDTIYKWRDEHPRRYERLRTEAMDRVYAAMAGEMEELFAEEVQLERELVARMRSEAPNLKPGEVSGALRNVGVTKALNVDKANIIRGRPSQITEKRTYVEVIDKLQQFGLIEGEAEEIPQPQLEEKTDGNEVEEREVPQHVDA